MQQHPSASGKQPVLPADHKRTDTVLRKGIADGTVSILSGIKVGAPDTYKGQLKEILSNENMFGMDLYEAWIDKKVESLFAEMIQEPGTV